jgi:hypothetical protein
MLPFSGIISNVGTIELNSAGNGILRRLIQHGVTLEVMMLVNEGSIATG